MLNQLHQTCRRLLDEGTVRVVVGYGQDRPDEPAHPIFVTAPDDVTQLVWNDRCFSNLTTYLTRKEVRDLGPAAIIVKGCDERALVVLEKESQIERSQVVVIGMACEGVGRPPLHKCETCDVRMPRFANVVIGQVDGRPIESLRRYADLDVFLQQPADRRMAYWRAELARCIKCYACRQVCPLCYCERCIADKNRPTCIDTSASVKGNFAWHITRALHLAGRCVGCDECTRVCPAGIELRFLNLAVARAAEESFGFRAGMDPAAEPVIGSYSQKDKEDFIR